MHDLALNNEQWGDVISHCEAPPELKRWMLDQVDRGLEYYQARIARIAFSGERVLDAGCGMGNWSLALARSFRQVAAMEVDAVRIHALQRVCRKVETRTHSVLGSIEAVPFANDTFDAVFCNGVVFLTDVQRSIGEFRRVLCPGGKLYLSYNGYDWWRHLIEERAKKDPVCAVYGCNALLELSHRYLNVLDLEHLLGPQALQSMRRHAQTLYTTRRWRFWRRGDLHRQLSNRLGQDTPSRQAVLEFETDVMQRFMAALGQAQDSQRVPAERLRRALTTMLSASIDSYRVRFVVDLISRVSLGQGLYRRELQTHSFEPDEMQDLLLNSGFIEPRSACEGCLELGSSDHDVAPIYDSALGVFEVVARVP